MKTAVSVPEDVFARADRLARAQGKSRSEVYSAALREYLARHAPDEVTEMVDRVMEELGEASAPGAFVVQAARRRLESADW
jgi:metal-responsive CopG/Arc/MetJ family transcriptional regulator